MKHSTSDSESSSARSLMRPAQSDAEKSREKKLRDDPMASVVNSTYIDCRRCGKRIKLSSKMAFDPLHWRSHRLRCLKGDKKKKTRADSVGSNEFQADPRNDICYSATIPQVEPQDSGLFCTTLPIPQIVGSSTDSDHSDSNKSPAPPYSPSLSASPLSANEGAVDANIPDVGSSPRYFIPRPYQPPTLTAGVLGPSDRWQSWDWSHLKGPDFDAGLANRRSFQSPVPRDGILMAESYEAMMRRDAAVSLSLLSRSN